MIMNQIDARQQLMAITAEECGELTQVCMKVLRRGVIDDELRTKLLEEAGDVLCMLELMQQYDIFSWQELEDRSDIKKGKLEKWSDLCQQERL